MPKSIAINTHLSVAAALTLGMTEHGWILVTPTAEELIGLDPVERLTLAPFVGDGERPLSSALLVVSSPGWSGVVEALRTKIAEDAAKRAESFTKVQSEIDSYTQILAAPKQYESKLPLKLLDHGVTWDSAPNYSRDNADAKALWESVERRREIERRVIVQDADRALHDEIARDADGRYVVSDQVKLVIEAARGYRDGRYQDVVEIPNARRLEAEAKCLNEEAVEARKQTLRDVARAYVREHVEGYARACDDPKADLTAVARRALLGGLKLVGDVEWTDGDERACDAPTDAAYSILDTVRDELSVLVKHAPGLLEIERCELVRLDTCPEKGCDRGWRLCAVATLDVVGETLHVARVADTDGPHVHETDEE